MGNAGSGTRPTKPGDVLPSSSPKDDKSFVFDKKLRSKELSHGSHDEDGPLYTKMAQSVSSITFQRPIPIKYFIGLHNHHNLSRYLPTYA